MARLNVSKEHSDDEEEDDLPDIATILRESRGVKTKQQAGVAHSGKKSKHLEASWSSKHVKTKANSATRTGMTRCTEKLVEAPEHRFTKPLLPICSQGLNYTMKPPGQDEPHQSTLPARPTPNRLTKKPVKYNVFSAKKKDRRISMSEEDESFTDLSGFIVPDSESDDGNRRRKLKPRKIKSSRAEFALSDQICDDQQATPKSPGAYDVINRSFSKIQRFETCVPTSTVVHEPFKKSRQSSTDSSRFENRLIQFSPPRSTRPSRSKEFARQATPPSSPSKPILDSPSKKNRIPPSPHRPSVDAFWSQDVINDWNDEYSPVKPPQTHCRNRLVTLNGDDDDENYLSPSVSQKISPTKSPNKKDRKERQAVKAFNKDKHQLATSFLNELDETITDREISNLTAWTGGTNILWSKKLASTAGRANWRREAVRRKNQDGTFSEPTYRHHASIELAEKVIDCEDRLINVLAHEFCHLANFMISGVKDQPHGKEFKIWAGRVTHAFKDRGVEVTTKHGYDINYKYVWTCGDCGLDYKRHSKSIDPSKHSCGSCKGKLAQVLPAPRKESEYQRFVKANWDRAKKIAGEGAGMGDINGLLAKEWEVKKVQADKGKRLVLEGAEAAQNLGEESGKAVESHEFDDVARRLDFLKIEA